MAEPPPPSYDDVVNPPYEGQPTAPPAQHLPPPEPAPADQRHPTPIDSHGGYGSPTHPIRPAAREARRESGGPTTAATTKSKKDRAIESYVSFSTAHLLRMHIEPRSQLPDPELDVEAQFSSHAIRSQQKAISKRQRKQCVSAWFWCIGVIQAILYIALPVAMIILGVLGLDDDCPFRDDIIVAYLFAGGCVLGITVFFRIIPSGLTIAKNHDWCSTRSSSACAGGICACECFFYLFFIANLGVLFFGTYAVFNERPDTSCEVPSCLENSCKLSIYAGSATCVILQYVLYAFSTVYLCLVIYCNRKWAKDL